jgi:DNA-binding transcriptional regulator YhcF (GntR family)
MHDDSTPFYMQVKGSLLEAIRSGELAPEAKIPSSAELCRKYGVSLITVRRAVGDLKSEGVLRGEFGKGVFVNSKQRGPSAKQSQAAGAKAIAGVWAAMLDENILHVQDGMNRYAQERGLSIELYPCKRNGPEESIEIFRQLATRGIKGVVVFPAEEPAYAAELSSLIRKGFRFVAVDRTIEGVKTSVVSSDNFGGRLLGRRSGFCARPRERPLSRRRRPLQRRPRTSRWLRQAWPTRATPRRR